MSNQVQPTIMGAITATLTTSLSAVTNGAKMIDNAMCAGERITYIAKSKASNLADLSDVADTYKFAVANRELRDMCKDKGITIAQDGSMTFDD